MRADELHVLNNGGKPISVRRRKLGTSYVLTVPSAVEMLVEVADEYRLEILEDGSLYYSPLKPTDLQEH